MSFSSHIKSSPSVENSPPSSTCDSHTISYGFYWKAFLIFDHCKILTLLKKDQFELSSKFLAWFNNRIKIMLINIKLHIRKIN